jgi:hypothetical protein
MPVSKAKKDPRVALFLAEVRSHYKISYHRCHDGGWGSSIADGVVHIDYDHTRFPGGALAHELLHILTQHRGYRRICIGFSTLDPTEGFSRVLTCLDNELQHHRMYPEFIRSGFAAEEFYRDDDEGVRGYLEQVLNSDIQNVIQILPDFFTVLAPGGCLTQTEREEFKARFLGCAAGRFNTQLAAVNAALEAWAKSTSYDCVPTLRELFMGLQNPCYTWIGFSEDARPPDDGVFIDQRFEIEAPEA